MTNFQRGYLDFLAGMRKSAEATVPQQQTATPNLQAYADAVASAGSEFGDPTYDPTGQIVIGQKYPLLPIQDRISSFKDMVNPQLANRALSELDTVGMPAFSNILNRAAANTGRPSAAKGAWQLWDEFGNGHMQSLAQQYDAETAEQPQAADVVAQEQESAIPPSDDPNYQEPSD